MGVRRRYKNVTCVRVRCGFKDLRERGLPGNYGRDRALCGFRQRAVQKKSLSVA